MAHRNNALGSAYRLMVESANDGIYLVEPGSGRIMVPNQALARIYGYSLAELQGMSVFGLHFPENLESAREALSRATRGEKLVAEFRTRRKDGQEIWVEVKPVLARLQDTEVIVTVTRDISARRGAEEALAISEERYRDLVEHAFDMINALDAAGHVVNVNQKTEDVLGYPRDQLLRMTVFDFTAREHWAPFQEHLRETIERGEASGFTCEWVTRTDGRVPVEINSTARYGRSGELLATRCIARDMTERRRLEERLVGAERFRAIGEVAAGVGHSFNNLLTVILARAERIQRVPVAPEVVQYAKSIEQAARDARVIVRRLQPSAETALTTRARVDLPALVLETVEVTRSRWQEAPEREGRQIVMRTELEAETVVVGDPVQLREVLTNLIFNAVDAMPHGGAITIETKQRGRLVDVSVSDTGTGMDEPTRRRLGEPFFTTKGARGGTGLGLFTVHRIVHEHGGEIEMSSVGGQGTTFSIRLPRWGT